jgi:hypothetical protein
VEALIMKRALFLLAVLAASTACDRCGTEVIGGLPQPVDQVDVFEQKQAAKVDVLWMVDNSESMDAEQKKVAERFNEFFSQLIRSAVDYHIGVVTSDPNDNGVLRAYTGPSVNGCSNCRFITTDVSCDNPAVDISSVSNSEIDGLLEDECQAQLVFRKLVSVGIEGSSSEQGFPQAAAALGAKDVDPATGLPLNNPPPENEGFIRPDAALYIVFVSDEEEGDKEDGTPVRYYQRLFESLKGAGNENKVAIAAITGYPTDNPDLPPIGEVCNVLQTTFDSNNGNDDPRASLLIEEMRNNFRAGCFDEEAPEGEAAGHAETGGRYLELACRTGGVVANMCEADYTTALDALGANAAGLIRKFPLSHSVLEIEWGGDCQPDTEDDVFIDCDDDGKTNGPLDGPLCVTAADLTESEPHLVPRDPNAGWDLEASTNSVRFDGGFLPKPGTQVQIRYLLRPKACNGV